MKLKNKLQYLWVIPLLPIGFIMEFFWHLYDYYFGYKSKIRKQKFHEKNFDNFF